MMRSGSRPSLFASTSPVQLMDQQKDDDKKTPDERQDKKRAKTQSLLIAGDAEIKPPFVDFSPVRLVIDGCYYASFS